MLMTASRKARPTTADKTAAAKLRAEWAERAGERGLTQDKMAEALDITQGAVSQYLNGRIPMNFRTLTLFCRALGIDDPGTIRTDLPEQRDGITVTREWPTSRNEGRLPYLAADQIAGWVAGGQPDVTDWMYCPAEDVGPRAFVTVVQGVAMSPQIEDGAFVFVDPDQPAAHGRLALILMPRPTVRKLVMEGDTRLLAATGRDWPGQKLTAMPADAVIAGAVVGKWVPA